MADEALRELARQSTRPVRLADVEKVVCDVFGIEPTQLRSDRQGPQRERAADAGDVACAEVHAGGVERDW